MSKANIMKFTDGLFLQTARKVAAQYEGRMPYEERLIDNMCMQLVQKPELYDVLVLPNLYGDIISDLCAGLVGGLGVAPGANIGDHGALFEATHGSAPKYKGMNKVNPTAMILSAKLMLEHLGEAEAARRLEVPMPLASLAREMVQSMMGNGYAEQDFSALILQQAKASGLQLKPENVEVDDGLSGAA